ALNWIQATCVWSGIFRPYAIVLSRVATSSGQLLTQELIGATCLPIPPLDEQRRIVRTLLAELTTLAQARAAHAAQHALVELLPAAELHAALAQLQAEGWPERQLGGVCCFHSGAQAPNSRFSRHMRPGYVRLLQIQD